MAEEEETQKHQKEEENHGCLDVNCSKREEEKKKKKILFFSIWPPTQSTRDAVVKRMVENLSSPSTFSKTYGTLSLEDASSTALVIEEEAFSIADASHYSYGDDNSTSGEGEGEGEEEGEDHGIETLQLYSRVISKRMLEAIKARATPPPPCNYMSQAK